MAFETRCIVLTTRQQDTTFTAFRTLRLPFLGLPHNIWEAINDIRVHCVKVRYVVPIA